MEIYVDFWSIKKLKNSSKFINFILNHFCKFINLKIFDKIFSTKSRPKSTYQYDAGQPSGYGAISGNPIRSTVAKIKGGQSDDSDISRSNSTTHCHENLVRDNNSNLKARKTLIIASILCLFFMIVEVVGKKIFL